MSKESEDRVWQDGETEKETHRVYQCPHCLTVYDERYGDQQMGIASGTSFTALPDSYECPMCEAPKAEFEAKEMLLN
nr:rubredoxin [Fodinibius salsisoli]